MGRCFAQIVAKGMDEEEQGAGGAEGKGERGKGTLV